LYLIGYTLGLYNLYKTIRSAPKSVGDETVSVVPLAPFHHDFNKEHPHRFLEGSADLFIVLSIIAVLVGSVIEILPTLVAHQYVTVPESKKPYSALALAGRDIYIREGCYTCHSQMVRPIVSEVLRYGAVSTAEDTVYDHPFQWGSKRTGPDLARVGGKYPDSWHYHHMRDPRSITPKSIMPGYPWLVKDRVDYAILRKKLAVMRIVGVPYTESDIATAVQSAQEESAAIAASLEAQGVPGAKDREITALIAYLQSLRAIDDGLAHEK
jgi:cytochrome c oxidase cbb3-type subunit I/II